MLLLQYELSLLYSVYHSGWSSASELRSLQHVICYPGRSIIYNTFNSNSLFSFISCKVTLNRGKGLKSRGKMNERGSGTFTLAIGWLFSTWSPNNVQEKGKAIQQNPALVSQILLSQRCHLWSKEIIDKHHFSLILPIPTAQKSAFLAPPQTLGVKVITGYYISSNEKAKCETFIAVLRNSSEVYCFLPGFQGHNTK